MFERRLRVILMLLAAAALVLLGRLVQLQVIHAHDYRRLAQQALVLKPTALPFVRGAIRDRTGETLVSNEPCWALAVDYGIIALEFDDSLATLQRETTRWRRSLRLADPNRDDQNRDRQGTGLAAANAPERTLRRAVEQMWTEVAVLLATSPNPVSRTQLTDRAQDIHERVQGVRRAVAERRGFDAPVAEETTVHAVAEGLTAEQQIAARERLSHYPWLRVQPTSARRFTQNAEPFAHLLGRVGRVDAATVANDPENEDPFVKYQADDVVGISGVEYAAEHTLRGRRGRLTLDREGNVVEQIDAEQGADVGLTIHAPLQRRLYTLLADAVAEHRDSSGGAIVVLDVHTRETLALVSYPSYDPNRFEELYPILRDDTDHLPMLFRAVGTRYPPGSTIKPLVCLAGLMSGKITLDSREECNGYLSAEHPDRWRCWEVRGTNQRMAHGSIDVVEALTGSCNIFMYRLGERLGVERLCDAFDMAGIGRPSGTTLREDEPGINPTPSWLHANKNLSVTPGTARLFAIGQGELAMTPVQVVNLMATYATGRYQPVMLIQCARPAAQWKLPATAEQLLAIRKGIYGVVNDPEGTAHKYVSFTDDRYALCGKTGSATAHPWPTAYRVSYVGEDGKSGAAFVPEASKEQAVARFRRARPGAKFDPGDVAVARRWPPHAPTDGENFSHAWFAGFLQPLDASGAPDWTKEPPFAFAVLIEFGGSGGATSGPLAARVARELIDVLGLNSPPLPGSEQG
jgi:penicillin-binding protein 2